MKAITHKTTQPPCNTTASGIARWSHLAVHLRRGCFCGLTAFPICCTSRTGFLADKSDDGALIFACGFAIFALCFLQNKSELGEIVMKLTVKHFSELSTEELFRIYKLRVSVFVVEQKCPYQEIDDVDRAAYHLWMEDADGIEVYARVLPQGAAFPTAAIGRVIAVKRRCGLGSMIVAAAIETAKEKLSADKITIEAQVYARSLYEKAGFRQISEEFLEDGIPHIKMQLDLSLSQ